jgi:phosphate starvation-inducible PhoH-like protein
MRAVQEDSVFRKPLRRPSNLLISPLNDAQRRYDAAIRSSGIIFGIGPAGTGKTYFAAMRAAEAFKDNVIERIVVTRPAVEAGESLGFLPGELDEKYEPYFRPVRDALEESFGSSHLDYLIKTGAIEARPLALLRGSTLKNAWVIADEMQNATTNQLKMFLSRIGENAKFIVNGDPRQSDLKPSESGLMDAVRRLQHVDGVTSVTFTRGDIVRSGLCQAVVEAFEDEEIEDTGVGLKRLLKAA